MTNLSSMLRTTLLLLRTSGLLLRKPSPKEGGDDNGVLAEEGDNYDKAEDTKGGEERAAILRLKTATTNKRKMTKMTTQRT